MSDPWDMSDDELLVPRSRVAHGDGREAAAVKSESERLLAEARSWERQLERLSPTFAHRERRVIELRIHKLRRNAVDQIVVDVRGGCEDYLGGDAA